MLFNNFPHKEVFSDLLVSEVSELQAFEMKFSLLGILFYLLFLRDQCDFSKYEASDKFDLH